jgi:hypothetical protein
MLIKDAEPTQFAPASGKPAYAVVLISSGLQRTVTGRSHYGTVAIFASEGSISP